MLLSVGGDFAKVFVDMKPYSLEDTGAICYITLYDRRYNDGTSWFIRSVDFYLWICTI